MAIPWKTQRSLENSLVEFLRDKANESGRLIITDEFGEERDVQIRVGFEFNNEATLPLITVYSDSKTAERLSIGSNLRLKNYILVIDIRALDVGMQQDLTDWLEETINDGFPFFHYSPSVDPSNPHKTQDGYASVEFISNTPLRLGDHADIFEKYRQNINISVFIN